MRARRAAPYVDNVGVPGGDVAERVVRNVSCRLAREMEITIRIAESVDEDAEKVYQDSLKKDYWKKLSSKFPGYNDGSETAEAVKWIVSQIKDDLGDDLSSSDWSRLSSALTKKVKAGIT